MDSAICHEGHNEYSRVWTSHLANERIYSCLTRIVCKNVMTEYLLFSRFSIHLTGKGKMKIEDKRCQLQHTFNLNNEYYLINNSADYKNNNFIIPHFKRVKRTEISQFVI